jgi:diguanylate cyclase (GGDEF)-like protein
MSEKCIYINNVVQQIYQKEITPEEAEDYFKKTGEQYRRYGRDEFVKEVQFTANGSVKILRITYRKMYDEKQFPVCEYFTINDLTKEREELQKERFRATHDSLTGVYNREYFFECVKNTLLRHRDQTYYMVCSNIKDFKLINELFGLEKGNDVLRLQAELLMEYSAPQTIYGRLQSDQFAVCVPKEVFQEEVFVAAIKRMSREFAHTTFHLHICVGIYEITDIKEDVSKMCDKAKMAGETMRNNYQGVFARYDEEMMSQSVHEKWVVSEFERAIKENEFCIYLQPQMTGDGVAHGAEALVRWNHPQ